MKLLRNIFINKRNNQASITIPSKILKKLNIQDDKPIKKILLEISIPKSKGGKVKT
jgi:antitoxin component of MazEF toxin-antitoxin module